MSGFKKCNWLRLIACFCGLSLFACSVPQNAKVFRTASSPNTTYTVNLKVGKATTEQIHADVLKTGQLFIPDILVHLGKGTFRPFNDAYPDLRWVHENVLEFYRPESFDQGSNLLQVENKSSQLIRYLQVESDNKFLLFDVQLGTTTSLKIPAPRFNSQWIAIEGLFSNGEYLPFTSKTFNRPSSGHFLSSYIILITDADVIIQSKDVPASVQN